MFVSNFELKVMILCNSNWFVYYKLVFFGCYYVDGYFNVFLMKYILDKL